MPATREEPQRTAKSRAAEREPRGWSTPALLVAALALTAGWVVLLATVLSDLVRLVGGLVA